MLADKLLESGNFIWTRHSLYKLKQYGLSQQRVKRVIRAPYRVEKGIVKNTVAVMVPAGNFKLPAKGEKPAWKQEIWAMYQTGAKSRKQKVESPQARDLLSGTECRQNPIQSLRSYMLQPKKLKIISAWRYPGVSPTENPIPAEILRELSEC